MLGGRKVCNVEPGTPNWRRLESLRVVIWDEATMSDNRVFRCVNQLFQRVW